MSSSGKDSNDPLTDRFNRVREIEKRIQDDHKPTTNLPAWQKPVIVLVCGAVFLFWCVWTGTWPIPRGKENREKAAVFLKHEFPERELRPSAEERSTAPVAAVFHIIRSGSADDATKAIQFAAEQNFGYASPYVIERLESDDPQLRHATRRFLRKMAGKDYGPNAEAWRKWWSDPTRSLLGVVTAGHHSVQMGIPIASGLLGVFLLSVGPLRKKDGFSALGGGLLVLGWFLFIGTTGIQFVGSFDTFTFGGTEIVYHQDHGVVEGLKDAKVGGAGLWLLLCLIYVAVPFFVMIGVFVVHQWRENLPKSKPPSTAG